MDIEDTTIQETSDSGSYTTHRIDTLLSYSDSIIRKGTFNCGGNSRFVLANEMEYSITDTELRIYVTPDHCIYERYTGVSPTLMGEWSQEERFAIDTMRSDCDTADVSSLREKSELSGLTYSLNITISETEVITEVTKEYDCLTDTFDSDIMRQVDCNRSVMNVAEGLTIEFGYNYYHSPDKRETSILYRYNAMSCESSSVQWNSYKYNDPERCTQAVTSREQYEQLTECQVELYSHYCDDHSGSTDQDVLDFCGTVED